MNYYYLNPIKEQLLFIKDKKDRDAVIDNIINLRAHLGANMPEKKLSGNLILGTWNLREFGATKYKGRMIESLYYIAEIISRFDLIAVQEIRENLSDINSICRILGSDWGIFTSLVTQGAAGNHERMSFLYDKRTVSFKNIAGQIVTPAEFSDDGFARSPYVIRFQSGWVKFDICIVHIYYGNASKNSDQYARRVQEIGNIVKFLDKYYVQKKEANNIFLLGDFNIEDTKSETYKAATSNKQFKIPSAILKGNLPGSNAAQDKIYDQILYYNKYQDITFKKAGTYNYYQAVFDKFASYKSRILKHSKGITAENFKTFKTYQMSDHLPLWIEMNTDHTDNYLKNLKKKEEKTP